MDNPIRFIDPDGMAYTAATGYVDNGDNSMGHKRKKVDAEEGTDEMNANITNAAFAKVVTEVLVASAVSNTSGGNSDGGDGTAEPTVNNNKNLTGGNDPKPWYGNFTGPGPNKNPYQLKDANGKTLQPIDMIDAAAQRHDYAYYKANTGGISGALFNRSVAKADIALARAADWVILYSILGIKDELTGKPITNKELSDSNYDRCHISKI